MKQLVVKMKCEVYKSVTCEGGSAEEMLSNPWDYAVDEMETDQINWEVVSSKEVR